MGTRVDPEEAMKAARRRETDARGFTVRLALDRRTLETIQVEARRLAKELGIPIAGITVGRARPRVKSSRVARPR
jgi:hypothetical protein